MVSNVYTNFLLSNTSVSSLILFLSIVIYPHHTQETSSALIHRLQGEVYVKQ